MNKVTIEMPLVKKCEADACAYNTGHRCHAKAITIGDGDRPGCDTFFENTSHTRLVTLTAGVGACKVVACRFNRDYECGAESIEVGFVANEARCRTFSPV
jgi:hypothetical protein